MKKVLGGLPTVDMARSVEFDRGDASYPKPRDFGTSDYDVRTHALGCQMCVGAAGKRAQCTPPVSAHAFTVCPEPCARALRVIGHKTMLVVQPPIHHCVAHYVSTT